MQKRIVKVHGDSSKYVITKHNNTRVLSFRNFNFNFVPSIDAIEIEFSRKKHVVMAHIQYVDTLIREYLLFRGFGNTLKTFESELKTDKDKGFRVDKIIDQITHSINSHDLQSLRDIWNHLDGHLFSKLEHSFATGKCTVLTSMKRKQQHRADANQFLFSRRNSCQEIGIRFAETVFGDGIRIG